jgi:hypothetical protein
MESNQAAEHLQIIRTLMERSALYRRALAPIMIFCGVAGISGGVAGWLLRVNTDRGFVSFWGVVAALALIGSFRLVRRQALKDSEPFWSPPTRRVAQALLPPLFIGLVMGVGVMLMSEDQDWLLRTELVLGWIWLFGCAICSAGFFMTRGIKLFGWLFILTGCALLACFRIWLTQLGNISPHLLMGGIFGGLHLAYGIYLYFTEKCRNEP